MNRSLFRVCCKPREDKYSLFQSATQGLRILDRFIGDLRGLLVLQMQRHPRRHVQREENRVRILATKADLESLCVADERAQCTLDSYKKLIGDVEARGSKTAPVDKFSHGTSSCDSRSCGYTPGLTVTVEVGADTPPSAVVAAIREASARDAVIRNILGEWRA